MQILEKARQLLLGSSRKTRILSAAGLVFALFTFGAVAVAPVTVGAVYIQANTVELELPLPKLASQIAELEEQVQTFVREEKVRWGDTIGTLLTRMSVNDPAAIAFIKSNSTADDLLRLMTGQLFRAKILENGELLWLSSTVSTDDDSIRKIVVNREEHGFSAVDSSIKLKRRIEMRSGEIRSSLFAATDVAQIPNSITNKFINMFSTNVDFRTSLRRGDRFNLVYETFWQNGNYVRSGRILGAEFINAGKVYNVAWYEGPGHDGGYYDFEGHTLKKAFLKAPVAFTRISSGFSLRRLHPITGKIRAHKGIDFAAPRGTPIYAAADGVVKYVGYRGGYGKFVVLKHWRPYSTAYGHMSRYARGLRRGKKVSQGDVIGYVGSTGMATGPHLHYEFRVNNVQRNPRVVDLPTAKTLKSYELQQFRVVIKDMLHRFALLSPDLKTATAK